MMSSQEMFVRCSFTLSDKVPHQDIPLIHKIRYLGFTVNDLYPLVIEKDSLSAGDLEALIKVVHQTLERKLGDDCERLEPIRLEEDLKENIFSLPENNSAVSHKNESVHSDHELSLPSADNCLKLDHRSTYQYDNLCSLTSPHMSTATEFFVKSSSTENKNKTDFGSTQACTVKGNISAIKSFDEDKDSVVVNLKPSNIDKRGSGIDENKPCLESDKSYTEKNQSNFDENKCVMDGKQSNDVEEEWCSNGENSEIKLNFGIKRSNDEDHRSDSDRNQETLQKTGRYIISRGVRPKNISNGTTYARNSSNEIEIGASTYNQQLQNEHCFSLPKRRTKQLNIDKSDADAMNRKVNNVENEQISLTKSSLGNNIFPDPISKPTHHQEETNKCIDESEYLKDNLCTNTKEKIYGKFMLDGYVDEPSFQISDFTESDQKDSSEIRPYSSQVETDSDSRHITPWKGGEDDLTDEVDSGEGKNKDFETRFSLHIQGENRATSDVTRPSHPTTKTIEPDCEEYNGINSESRHLSCTNKILEFDEEHNEISSESGNSPHTEPHEKISGISRGTRPSLKAGCTLESGEEHIRSKKGTESSQHTNRVEESDEVLNGPITKSTDSNEECNRIATGSGLASPVDEQEDSSGVTKKGNYLSNKTKKESFENSSTNGSGASPGQLSKKENASEEEYITIHIPADCEVGKNLTILRLIARIPKRMNYSEVEIDVDNLKEGSIMVKGKACEVLKVEEKIKEMLKDTKYSDGATSKNDAFEKHEDNAASIEVSSSVEFEKESLDKRQRISRKPDTQRLTSSNACDVRRKKVISSNQPQLEPGEYVTKYSAVRVKVMKADITVQKVDAIVSAANSGLRLKGGVAKVISDRAGPELQRECSNFTKDGWSLPVTGIFVSSGGRLSAKRVVHAVGPKWKAYGQQKKEECAQDLRRTVLRCLVEADQLGFRSIAIPSIGAGISARQAKFSVPIQICTKAYLEAVHTYDIYKNNLATSGQSVLHKVLFVDIMEDIVGKIRQHFTSQWLEEPSLQQLTDDLIFICEHYPMNSLRADTVSPPNQEDENGQSIRGAMNAQSTYPMTQSRLGSSEQYPYTVGQAMLRASSESAIKQKPDLIVVVGDLFPNLHCSSNVDIAEVLSTNETFSERKGFFKAFGGSNACPLTFQFPTNSYTEEDFKKAFGTLLETTTNLIAKLQHVTTVVFTSSALYSNDFTASAYPEDVDKNLVEAFTHQVYEFLGLFTPPAGILFVTVAAGCDALPNVHEVLELKQKKVNKPQEKDIVSNDVEEPIKECGVCLMENTVFHPLDCCYGNLCTSCKKMLKDKRCPFCRTLFTHLTGNQPQGKMHVKLNESLRLKGFKEFSTIVITYDFPSGHQGENHPEPGRAYDGVQRVAYLPASKKGIEVLCLLRLAFLRHLTFTIGESLTTGRKGVITWNDIHHKTSLTEGSPFGYPDLTYLSRVTQELSDKGVSLNSMTRDERKNVNDMEKSLNSSSKSFQDTCLNTIAHFFHNF